MTTIMAPLNQVGEARDLACEPARDSANRSGNEGIVAALLATAWMLGSGQPGSQLYVGVTVALALALVVVGRPFAWRGLLSRLGLGVAHLLTIVLLVMTTHWLLARWEERSPRLAISSYASSIALNLLGYKAAAERGFLLLDHPEGLVSLTPSFEKLAVGPFLIFWIAWIGLRAVRKIMPSIGNLIVGLGFTLFVGLARYLTAVLIYVEHDQILVGDPGQTALDLLESPWIIAPFLFFAGLALDRSTPRGSAFCLPTRHPHPTRRLLAASSVMMGISGAAGFCWSFAPPGAEKSGRILIDDRFCGIWEPTARRLDTNWYGDFPTYSFTSLAEWLGKWYAVDANIGQPYDDELLSRYDILIIKTPDEAIPDPEADAIDRFVHRGGGLLLVGDHTNLLGMGTHLNALSAKYGIRFRYDAISDGASGGFVNCYGPLIGRHIGALHVEHFEFMTSCSLQLSKSAETVLAADGCLRDPHDYAGSSFFGRRGPHPEAEHGRTVLAATVRVGDGRIAAFTDSTVWSSFAVFDRDREKLAMDLIRLLNREPSNFRLAIRGIAIVAIVGTIILGGLLVRLDLANTALFFGLLGLWAGVAGADSLHRWIYTWPQPKMPLDGVSFLWEGGRVRVSTRAGSVPIYPPRAAFRHLAGVHSAAGDGASRSLPLRRYDSGRYPCRICGCPG